MEHSKGKLESNDIFPWDLWIGADKHLFTVHGEREIRIANAKRLKKCWNERDMLAGMAGQANMALCVYRRFLEQNGFEAALADIDKELQAIDIKTGEYDTLKAKAALFDELVEELDETVKWIKTDVSYKAPEQLRDMAADRWMPKIMGCCESILAKCKAVK